MNYNKERPRPSVCLIVLILSALLSSQFVISGVAQVKESKNSDEAIDLLASTKEINSGTKTQEIPGNDYSTVEVASITYEQGWYLLSEITLRTNHSSFLWETEYAVTLQYHQFGFDQPILETEDIEHYTNDTNSRYLQRFHNIGETSRSIYLTLHILPGTIDPSKIVIEYRIQVVEAPNSVTLDETKSYVANVSSYYNYYNIDESPWAYNIPKSTLVILPTNLRAKNETQLPYGYSYLYDIVILFSVIGANDERTSIELKVIEELENPKTSDTLRVEGGGKFLAIIPQNRHDEFEGYVELVVEHSGEAIELSILQVQLSIYALVEVPPELLVPPWVYASGLAIGLITGFSSMVVVREFGKSKLKQAKIGSIW